MADAYLDPPRSMPTYAVRAPLVRWLREQAEEAHRALGRYRVLDVGCGLKPYQPLFARYSASYVGVDPVANELAKETAALRIAVATHPLQRRRYLAQRGAIRAVLEIRREVAGGGEAEASDRRTRRLINGLVDSSTHT